ncbi:MAG TPA: EVE domain-containing protein [Lacunisphaera sp.]|nr:EVE domain-containing protein [Lacunisphaera sp.]
MKSEPGTYSWDNFAAERRTAWTGVRNYAARLHLRAMRAGDQVLFYHSGEAKSIVGLARVTKAAFPDPTADEPGWVAVELAAGRPLPSPVTLATVKATPALKAMALIRLGRLSVQPVKPAEFKAVLKLAGG